MDYLFFKGGFNSGLKGFRTPLSNLGFSHQQLVLLMGAVALTVFVVVVTSIISGRQVPVQMAEDRFLRIDFHRSQDDINTVLL